MTTTTAGVYDGLTRVQFGSAVSGFTTSSDYMQVRAFLWVPDVLEDDSQMTMEVQFDYYSIAAEAGVANTIQQGSILGQYATFKSESLENFTLACSNVIGERTNFVYNFHGANTYDALSDTVIDRSYFAANSEDFIEGEQEWNPFSDSRRMLKRVPTKDVRHMQHRHKHHRSLKKDAALNHAKKVLAALKHDKTERAVSDVKKMKHHQKAAKAEKSRRNFVGKRWENSEDGTRNRTRKGRKGTKAERKARKEAKLGVIEAKSKDASEARESREDRKAARQARKAARKAGEGRKLQDEDEAISVDVDPSTGDVTIEYTWATVVWSASDLSESVYYEHDTSLEADHVTTFYQRAQWWASDFAYFDLVPEYLGFEMSISVDTENETATITLTEPNTGGYTEIDTNSLLAEVYLPTDILFSESWFDYTQLMAMKEVVDGERDAGEAAANMCEDVEQADGTTRCVYPNGNYAIVDADFNYKIYDEEDDLMDAGNLNDYFWYLLEYARYEIVTTEGVTITFDMAGANPIARFTNEDGSYAEYAQYAAAITEYDLAGGSLDVPLTLSMINEILMTIDWDALYELMDNDETADYDFTADGLLSTETIFGTELRINTSTGEITEYRGEELLNTYTLQDQFAVIFASAAGQEFEFDDLTVTISSVEDQKITFVDSASGMTMEGDTTTGVISTMVTGTTFVLTEIPFDVMTLSAIFEYIGIESGFEIHLDGDIVVINPSNTGIMKINTTTMLTKEFDWSGNLTSETTPDQIYAAFAEAWGTKYAMSGSKIFRFTAEGNMIVTDTVADTTTTFNGLNLTKDIVVTSTQAIIQDPLPVDVMEAFMTAFVAQTSALVDDDNQVVSIEVDDFAVSVNMNDLTTFVLSDPFGNEITSLEYLDIMQGMAASFQSDDYEIYSEGWTITATDTSLTLTNDEDTSFVIEYDLFEAMKTMAGAKTDMTWQDLLPLVELIQGAVPHILGDVLDGLPVFDTETGTVEIYDEDQRIEIDVTTFAAKIYDEYENLVEEVTIEDLFASYIELVGQDIPMSDTQYAKISYDGGITIMDTEQGTITTVELSILYLVTRNAETGDFISEVPLTYMDVLNLKTAADELIDSLEPEYAEEYDPLEKVNYEVDDVAGTVTIFNDDGSYLKIKLDSFESTMFAADGTPSEPVKLIALLAEEVPKEVWGTPIPVGDGEFAKIVDEVTIEINDYESGYRTDVDLITRTYTKYSSEGEEVDSQQLTWDVVYSFITSAHNFYDELYGNGDEDDEDYCETSETSGNYVCYVDYGHFEIDSNFLVWEYDNNGDLITEYPMSNLFRNIALDAEYIDWQLYAFGDMEVSFDTTTGNIEVTTASGDVWTIDHNSRRVAALTADGIDTSPMFTAWDNVNDTEVQVEFGYNAEHLQMLINSINLDEDNEECETTVDGDLQTCTFADGSYEQLDMATLIFSEYDSEGYLVFEESIGEVFEDFARYQGATIYTEDGEEVEFKTDGTLEMYEPTTGITTKVDPYQMTLFKEDITGTVIVNSEEDLTYEMVLDFVYGLDIAYLEYNIDFDTFCDSFPELCVDDEIDLAAVCDNLYIFPEEYFGDTGVEAMCEVDFGEACEAFPELCDEETGAFSSDICGLYPDMCDESTEDYNPCAEDLLSCILDPDFDVCDEFPEVCGIPESVYIPVFESPYDSAGAYTETFGDVTKYSCIAQISASFEEVEAAVGLAEHYFDISIDDEWEMFDVLSIGARVYESLEVATFENKGDAESELHVWFPQVEALQEQEEDEDYGDFEDLFQETEQTKFDLFGEAFVSSFDESAQTESFMTFQAGYKIEDIGEDEPLVYLGFNFITELPTDLFESDSQIVQWVKYQMRDEDYELTGTESAIACITTVYEPYKAEVKEFEFDTPFEVEDTTIATILEDEIETNWITVEEEEYYYADVGRFIPDSNEMQNCLAAVEFDTDSSDYGYYSVTFGARLVTADGTETDLITGESDVYFRPPETDIAETEVQVQGNESNDATVTVDGADVSISQEFFIGYEITQDFDTPNYMGMMFELDIPSDLIPDRAIIYQYAQYRKSVNYAGDWVTVGCKNQVDVRDSQEVLNFRGKAQFTGRDDSDDMTAWNEQHLGDFVAQNPRDGTEFFEVRIGDDEVYELEQFGSAAGNKLQKCLAMLEFPKTDFDQDWFGEYDVRVGARIYKKAYELDFVQVPDIKFVQMFDAPEYNEDIESEIEAEFNVQSQNFMWEEEELSYANICGTDTDAILRLLGDLEINPDEEAMQKVVFRVELGVPEVNYDQCVGYIMATHFVLQDEDDSDNVLNFVCRTTIGDEFTHDSSMYDSAFDSTANMLDTTYALDEEDSPFTAATEWSFYETFEEDGFMMFGCNMEFSFYLNDADAIANVFETFYDISATPYIYQSEDSTDRLEIESIESYIYIPDPEFNEYVDAVPEEAVTEHFWVNDIESITSVAGDIAVQRFNVTFEVNQDYNEDDIISFSWSLDIPDSLFTGTSGAVEQYISFKKELDFSDNLMKYQCVHELGGDIYHYNFYGPKEMTDAAFDDGVDTWNGDEYIDSSSVPEDATFLSDPEEESKTYASEIENYTVYECHASIILPKMDRDFNIFGTYQALVGARIHSNTGSLGFESMNSAEIEYDLEEPLYDSYEETSFSEREYQMLKYKDFEVDVADAFDVEGYGTQTFMVELITSKAYTEDDILRITFYLDLPSELMQEGTVVYQWAQLLVDGQTYGTDDMIGVGCAAVMSSVTDITHVYNFEGINSLENGAGVTDTIFNSTLVDDFVPSYDGPFADFNETWAYEDWNSGIDGNLVKTCVADMKISKSNRDESLFTEYVVTVGAHLYDSWDSESALATKQQRTKYSLSEPDYDAELVDDATVALFIDESENGAADKTIAGLGSAAAEIDVSTLGFSGSAQQFFYAAFEVSTDIDEDDLISLYFSVDLPKDVLEDGTIIYQWANLLADGQSAGDDSLSFSCQTTVGDFAGTKVREYFGSTSLDSTTQGSALVDEQNTSDLLEDSDIEKREDESFYALQESAIDIAKNKVQPCLLQIPLDKFEDNSAIFTTYTVTIGARIYTDKTDTSPMDLGSSTTQVTIDEPEYTSNWSEYDDYEYGQVESTWIYIGYSYNTVDDTSATLDIAGSAYSSVYTDLEVNKDFTMPNFWKFWFYADLPADSIVDGSSVFQWITLTPTSGSPVTIGCMMTIDGEDYNEKIFEWKGASTFDAASVGDSTSINDLYSGEYSTDFGVRSTNQEWDYSMYEYENYLGEQVKSLYCTAQIDIPKTGVSTLWDTYTITNGVRVYESDMTTYKTLIDAEAGTESFIVEEVTSETYEFGDEYEFSAEVVESDVFSMSESMAVADILGSGDGTIFMKTAGGFKAIPNFETAIWYFRVELEMPTELFDTENVMYAEITFEPTDSAFPAMTVTCAAGIADPENVIIEEFDENFVSVASGDATITGQNSENKNTESDWSRDYEMQKYDLVESINDKSRQSCVAQVEVPPEEAAYFFDNTYDVTVAGRIYDNWESSDFVGTGSFDYTFDVPASEFEFKEQDFTVTDVQIATSESFSYTDELGVSGESTQQFSAGFEINPYDDEANDAFGFWWSLDASSDVLVDGAVVYQYVSYAKSGTEGKKITVGCATKVGDPYVSRIDTFNGTTSMSASAQSGSTWDEQNADEKAFKVDSYILGDQTVAYKGYESSTSGNIEMPCLAMLIFDGKLEDTDDFYGTYDVTIGARVYSSDYDTAPVSVPDQTFSITLGEPVSDLSSLYEEDEPEDSSETLESFSEKQRFKNEDVFSTEFVDGDDRWSYQIASGGYKLYDSSSATERWYWDLALVMPTKYFTEGRIMYQWITFADEDKTDALTGAVACKTVVGDVQATQVDQWIGEVVLDSTDDEVTGKRWYKQQRDSKMEEPLYRALFWDTIFELTEVEGRDGYSVQHCQAEIEIEGDSLPDNATIDMKIGARFYADDDATEFLAVDGKVFDWFNEVISYDAAYEIEPVYDIDSAKGKVEAEIVTEPQSLTDTFSQTKQDAYTAAVAAAAEEVEDQSSGLVVQKSRQDTEITATTSVGHGWTIYENEVESDYWWWYVATDMGTSLVDDGEILYQWVTMVDQSATYTEDPFTVGCAITKGTDDTYTVQIFTHTSDPDTTTYLQADSDPSVVGQKWAEQDSDEIEVLSDTAWTSGTTHHGSNTAPDSTESLNTNFACYFAKEYAKIGRNPNDFDKDFQVTVGARLYGDDDATTFDTIPSPDAFTVTLTEPDSYATPTATGAFSLFASSLAAVAMLFALAF